MAICYFLKNVAKDKGNCLLVFKNNARRGFLVIGSNWKTILGPTASGQGPVITSGPIKYKELLEQPSDHCLLMKDSVPWMNIVMRLRKMDAVNIVEYLYIQ
jgi:hypothetical protein